MVRHAHHDPFERAGVMTQAVVNNLRFPGQYFDAETDFHYNYFRDYDSSSGRYIQSDPIGPRGSARPLAAWRVYPTAEKLCELQGRRSEADGFRQQSRAVILQIADSLDACVRSPARIAASRT